ncbi:hypothetical protein MODO_2624 [Myroides odoratimimus]|nr:hypothetical protein MODO_2624 [Myroides odoratimimus]
MVQLKEAKLDETQAFMLIFQYLYGAVKRKKPLWIEKPTNRFQYLYGAVKR